VNLLKLVIFVILPRPVEVMAVIDSVNLKTLVELLMEINSFVNMFSSDLSMNFQISAQNVQQKEGESLERLTMLEIMKKRNIWKKI
jgi:hypothetical protein